MVRIVRLDSRVLTRRVLTALAIAGIALLLACPRTITDSSSVLTVTPAAATLALHDSTRFGASLADHSGAAVQAAFVWSVDDPRVALVDTTGMVRAVAAGTTTVRVTARGATATAPLTVAATPPPPPSGGRSGGCGYSSNFIPVAGSTFTDSGSASCH